MDSLWEFIHFFVVFLERSWKSGPCFPTCIGLVLEMVVRGIGEVSVRRWKSLQRALNPFWNGLFESSTYFWQNAFMRAGFGVILQRF